MTILIELVVSVLKMLAELWITQAKEPSYDTAIDADRDPALRDRLVKRVRESGSGTSNLDSIGRTGPVS